MTVVYVVIAPFVESVGFPPIAALLLAILVVPADRARRRPQGRPG